MNELDNLSSSQYAFRAGICLTKTFEDDEDYYEDVYYTFKGEGRALVGQKYPNKIFYLSCFPYTFSYKPKKSDLEMMFIAISINLGFLNKDLHDEVLIKYLKIIFNQKYYMYDFNIDINKFKKQIQYGKSKELAEMNLSKKKYVWRKEYQTLSKSMKCKIMNEDRFKKVVTDTTEKVFDAVSKLLNEYDDFIHTGVIADITGLKASTLFDYIQVHKERINEHNKARYGTANYNEYISQKHLIDVENAIMNLKFQNKKVTIKNIADKTNLHRNTISKLNKKHHILDFCTP